MALNILAPVPHVSATGPPIPRKTPYQSLDAWRGAACFGVLFYHCFLSFTGLTGANGHPFSLIASAGYLGVQLFFVISGYCIANAVVAATRRKNGFFYFFQARVRRIFPAYLAVLALSIGGGLLARGLTAAIPSSSLARLDFLHQTKLFFFSIVTLTQIPLHQDLVQPVFWTLNFEVAFYVIVGLLLLLPEQMRREYMILRCLHFITLASLAGLVLHPSGVPFPFSFWPQFGLGVLVFDLLLWPGNRVTKALFATAVLETVLFCVLRDERNPFVFGVPSLRISYCVCLVFAALLMILKRFDGAAIRLPLVRFLMWAGGFSYSLYLVHPLVIGVTRQLARRAFDGRISAAAEYLLFGMEVAASVLCARGFFFLVERRFLNTSSRPVQDVKPIEQGLAISQVKTSQT